MANAIAHYVSAAELPVPKMKLKLLCLVHGHHLRTLLASGKGRDKKHSHGIMQRSTICVSL